MNFLRDKRRDDVLPAVKNMQVLLEPLAVVTPERLRRQMLACIALVLAMHVALLWLATGPAHMPAVRDNRHWVQLLRPEPSREAEPVNDSQPKARLPGKGLPAMPALSKAPPEPSTPMPAPAAQPAPTSVTERPEEHALLADATATQAPASTLPADVVQQALKAVGASDRQLRAEHRQEFTAPADTPHTRLVKGLAAAHAAVKPKWFEAARTELISAPNDPKRIYRVATAMGEYCLYFPDKGGIAANSNPKSGFADFGQPTASSCPIQF